MIPAAERMNRASFKRFTESNPRSVYNKSGTFKFGKSKKPLLSIVVSSKHEKKAVIRNRTKRRFYRALSEVMKDQPSIQGVIFVSKLAYSFSYEEIRDFVFELFRKAHEFNR